jgi:hypothetical protein
MPKKAEGPSPLEPTKVSKNLTDVVTGADGEELTGGL